MTKTAQNLTMYAGETKTITAPTTNAAGAAQSLTGGTVAWYLRTAAGATPVVTKTTTSGITLTTTTAANDTVNVALLPADTSALAGVYLHECQATDSGGTVSLLWTGYITILKV